MLTLVTAKNAARHVPDLAKMFRLRHRVFVEEAGWLETGAKDGLEIDKFDTPDASYLLAKSGNSDVIGVTRLIPTTKPHLNSEVFQDLCNREGVPRGDTIWETSRYAVDPKFRFTTSGQPVAAILWCGIFELALACNLSHLTFVTESRCLTQILEVQRSAKPLGVPKEINGISSVAVLIEVNELAVHQQLAHHGLKGPLITDGLIDPRELASAA